MNQAELPTSTGPESPKARALRAGLAGFQKSVNVNARLKPILKGWEPDIVVHASDIAFTLALRVRAGEIAAVVDGVTDAPHSIRIEGGAEVLQSIFEGTINPGEALLDGTIAVFGSDKDQVKLDAISLVMWGL